MEGNNEVSFKNIDAIDLSWQVWLYGGEHRAY